MPCGLNWKLSEDFPDKSYQENSYWVLPKSVEAELGLFRHKVRESISLTDVIGQRDKFDELARGSQYALQNRNSCFIGNRFLDFIRPKRWSEYGSWFIADSQNDLNAMAASIEHDNEAEILQPSESSGLRRVKPVPGPESYFCLPEFQIKGFIDELVIENNEITVCEFKSHKFINENTHRSEFQCELYALAVSEFYPDHNIRCKLEQFGIGQDGEPLLWDFTKERKKSVAKRLKALIKNYENEGPIPVSGTHCSWCRYRSRCPMRSSEIQNRPYPNQNTLTFDVEGVVTSVTEVIGGFISLVEIKTMTGKPVFLRDIFVGFDPYLKIDKGDKLSGFNLKTNGKIKETNGKINLDVFYQSFYQHHVEPYEIAMESLIVVDSADG